MRATRAPLAADGAVVIAGAGLGGLRCAEALRNLGFSGRVTMIGDEPGLPYDRPPLTKQLLSGQWDASRIELVSAAKLDELGIQLRGGVTATSLDVEAREVALVDGTTVRGDAVVVATGAQPRWLPGTEGLPGVHVVRTLAQGEALRDALAALPEGARVVVVGAGFIGAEVASTAAAAGHHVVLLEGLDVPLSPIVGPMVGEWLTDLHRDAGVEVRTAVAIAAVHPAADGPGATVELVGGSRVDADLVVLGIGVTPTTSWLDGSALTIDNGVVTDASLFAADGVVAVGDLARFEWHHGGFTEQVRIEHWEVTAQMASAAAHSLLAGRDDAPRVSLVPYFWSDQHGRKIQMLGRPAGTDDVTVLAGTRAESKFTVAYHRGGRLTGVLGLASPRNVMVCRSLVDAAAPVGDAVALFAGT